MVQKRGQNLNLFSRDFLTLRDRHYDYDPKETHPHEKCIKMNPLFVLKPTLTWAG